MTVRAQRALPALALAVAFTLVGCGDGGGSGIERADADTAIDVVLRDFAFDGMPASVKGPKLFIAATNAGPAEHELEILGADGKAVDEIEAMAAGRKGSLGVEIAPGSYTVQCILTTAEGKSHKDLGMVAQLRVQ